MADGCQRWYFGVLDGVVHWFGGFLYWYGGVYGIPLCFSGQRWERLFPLIINAMASFRWSS
jgi:hypothetical protein